jgi:hypothetical protein
VTPDSLVTKRNIKFAFKEFFLRLFGELIKFYFIERAILVHSANWTNSWRLVLRSDFVSHG